MWHKAILSINEGYKGWQLFITPNSNYTKDLKVTISPGVKINISALQHLTDLERLNLNKKLQMNRDRQQYTFIVKATRTLLIFEFLTPWARARKQAENFIDQRLGKFNLEKFISDSI